MISKRRTGRALALVLGLAGVAVAAPAAAAQPLSTVQWGTCPEDVAAAGPQLQCATIEVPLDYARPDGAKIELALSRLPSQEPAQRRGVLMLNPGGPGGSGLTFPAFLAERGMPASVLNAYDVIGMDTRGVGRSSPISCGFTADGDYQANIPPYAADDQAVLAQAKIAQAAAEQCAANDTEGRVGHITTANMARDLDRIRVALGEPKASFLGYSYGSALGSAYASMFPATADRVVLDSSLGDTHLDHAGMRRFALGAEETFPDFAEWVARRDASYGLGKTPRKVRETYFALARQLDEHPMPGLDGKVFRLATFVGLYGKARYGVTAQIWQSVKANDVEAATRLKAQAALELSPADNAFSVFLAVTCNDVEWSRDVKTYQRALAEDRKAFPVYGGAPGNVLPCAFWKYDHREPPVAIDPRGPANVLIVQNRHDPATPLAGARLLDDKLGDRSSLLEVPASGHGAYVLGDNACAHNTTTKFLLDGKLPRSKTC